MKRFGIILLLFFCLEVGFAKEITIPFKCKKNGRITIQFLDKENNDKYIFYLDTASTTNVLFQRGYDKISKSFDFDIITFTKESLRNDYPELTDEELTEITLAYINQGGLTFTHSGLKSNDFCSTDSLFVYEPVVNTSIDDSKFDGLINLDFFGDINNIIIDYKKKIISINSNRVLKNSVKYQKFDTLNLYVIDVTFNNIKQQAIIDTGACYFFLKENYQIPSITTEADLIKELKTGINVEADKHNEKRIRAFLEIGNYRTKVTGIYPDPTKYNATEEAKSIINLVNLLGYPAFKNHIIQFDFEKKEFRIE